MLTFNQTFASRQPKKTCLVLTQQDSNVSHIFLKGLRLNYINELDPNITYKNFTLTCDDDGKITATSDSRQIVGRTTISAENLLVGQAIIAYRQSEGSRNYMDFKKIDNDKQPSEISDTTVSCGNNEFYVIPAKDILWKIGVMNAKNINKKLHAINQEREKQAQQKSQKEPSWSCILS